MKNKPKILNMAIQWSGVFPALTTKFTSDDKLDFPLFEKNLKAQLDAGVEGVILGGTLGEACVLSNEEKLDLVKFTVEKVVQLVAGAWNVSLLGRISSRMAMPGIRRVPVVVMLVVAFVYVHLYSVWQDILTTPWLLLLFALTFSQSILFVVSPHREQRISWHELSLALVLFLYPRMIQEFRLLFPGELIYRMATIIGMAFVLALVFAMYSTYNEKIRQALIAGREKIKAFRFPLIVMLCLTPLIYRCLVLPETYGVYDDIRLANSSALMSADFMLPLSTIRPRMISFMRKIL